MKIKNNTFYTYTYTWIKKTEFIIFELTSTQNTIFTFFRCALIFLRLFFVRKVSATEELLF